MTRDKLSIPRISKVIVLHTDRLDRQTDKHSIPKLLPRRVALRVVKTESTCNTVVNCNMTAPIVL